MTVFIITAKNR